MTNKTNQPTKEESARKSAFITLEAYQHLDDLCDILAEEKKITKHNYMDAISNAVITEAQRAMRRRQRRQQADLARA